MFFYYLSIIKYYYLSIFITLYFVFIIKYFSVKHPFSSWRVFYKYVKYKNA